MTKIFENIRGTGIEYYSISLPDGYYPYSIQFHFFGQIYPEPTWDEVNMFRQQFVDFCYSHDIFILNRDSDIRVPKNIFKIEILLNIAKTEFDKLESLLEKVAQENSWLDINE